MIENFVKYIENKDNSKDNNFIIFDIGSRDCGQSIEFYNTFPNAQIYAFECNPNTIDICKQNIVKYSDRITLIEGAVCALEPKKEVTDKKKPIKFTKK
jgi:methylase of polypeptide subunit release factors